jgi:hypothetical protein
MLQISAACASAGGEWLGAGARPPLYVFDGGDDIIRSSEMRRMAEPADHLQFRVWNVPMTSEGVDVGVDHLIAIAGKDERRRLDLAIAHLQASHMGLEVCDVLRIGEKVARARHQF